MPTAPNTAFDLTGRVALVTGGGTGIGQAIVLALAEAGTSVGIHYHTSQKTAEETAELVRGMGLQAFLLPADLTIEEQAKATVDRLVEQAGRLDVLVNNAGYGSYGAVEDVPLDEARRQFEVNVFGAARLIQLVMPTMRGQKSGTIINITSMGGKIYTPFGAWYHATKFALESFSDCLRLEAKPFGINVVVVEPGAIRTEWSSIAADHLVDTSAKGAYADKAGKVAKSFRSESMAKQSSPAEVVAKTVVKAATARRPKTRYAVGFGAKPLIFTRGLLPDRAYDSMILRVGGVR